MMRAHQRRWGANSPGSESDDGPRFPWTRQLESPVAYEPFAVMPPDDPATPSSTRPAE